MIVQRTLTSKSLWFGSALGILSRVFRMIWASRIPPLRCENRATTTTVWWCRTRLWGIFVHSYDIYLPQQIREMIQFEEHISEIRAWNQGPTRSNDASRKNQLLRLLANKNWWKQLQGLGILKRQKQLECHPMRKSGNPLAKKGERGAHWPPHWKWCFFFGPKVKNSMSWVVSFSLESEDSNLVRIVIYSLTSCFFLRC